MRSFLRDNKTLSGLNWKTIERTTALLFLYATMHIVYFKPARGLVDVQFKSWPNVMKKMKFLAVNEIYCKKCKISKTIQYIDKHWDSLGATWSKTIRQNKNLNIASRNWIQKCGKTFFFQKGLKQCHITEMCTKKRCDMFCFVFFVLFFFSTTVHKVLKSYCDYSRFEL